MKALILVLLLASCGKNNKSSNSSEPDNIGVINQCNRAAFNYACTDILQANQRLQWWQLYNQSCEFNYQYCLESNGRNI
jgi:hypothetical protein